MFGLYESGDVKGQRRHKRQVGVPDCKQSKWQFMHNLPEAEQFQLLRGISTKDLS